MNHTIKIGDYEVTITGIRDKFHESLTDTDELIGQFINHISLMATEAGYYNTEKNYPSMADDFNEISKDCYNFCDRLGVYNKYKVKENNNENTTL